MTTGPRRALRVTLFGPRTLAGMRIVVAVLGLLFIIPLLAFPVTFMQASEEERLGLVIMMVLAALVFGLPAWAAMRILRNPPRDAFELDDAGMRRVDGKLDWDLSWWQVSRIGLRIVRRRRWRSPRRVTLEIEPAVGATVKLPGALQDGRVAQVRLPDDLFSKTDPQVVQDLDEALRVVVPHLYQGIRRH